MTPTHARRLEYQPGLDGIRGVSVAAVLLFHSGFTWAGGGFLGVSTFFTLSGFLICSLLLAERRDEGEIDLRAFWGRRFRRLMPAALGGLSLAIVFGLTVADSAQLTNLKGDVIGALLYAANWRFVLDGQSYGDLFLGGDPSPVLHYWSLAIEEQFYVFFPLIVVAVVRSRGDRSRALPATLGALAVASVVASVALVGEGGETDRVYYGTDTRSAELLIGALLAWLWHNARSARKERLLGVAAVAAPAVLLAQVAAWGLVENGQVWLYRGGLTLYAAGTAVVILGAMAPKGMIRSLLASAPLRTAGRYSYGIYVFHWPVFRWLTPERTDLDDAPLLALRAAITVGLAVVSYHLIEHPIRTRRALAGRGAIAAALAAASLVGASTLALDDSPSGVVDFESVKAEYETRTTTPPTPASVDRPTVAFYGDSMALMSGLGFSTWLRTVGVFSEEGGGFTQLGCGLMGKTEQLWRGTVITSKDECEHTLELWDEALEEVTPDICVVMSGMWNVDDRKLPGSDEWVALGDAPYDDHLRGRMQDAVDIFDRHGCISIWILIPYSVAGTVDGVQPSEEYPENDPARYDRLNEIIRDLVADNPEEAAFVDLPGWMDTIEGGQLNTELRPDLVHFGWEDGTAATVANSFLGWGVYEAYRGVVGDDVAPSIDRSRFLSPEIPTVEAVARDSTRPTGSTDSTGPTESTARSHTTTTAQ